MKPLKYAVTTSHKQTPDLVGYAKEIAGELGCVYVERNEQPLEALITALSADGLLVVAAGKLSFMFTQGEFFFHPGLAGLRIKQLNSGKTDRMIEAMSLKPGESVLDCTLGLGTDAIVAGYAVGVTGRVVGLECSPILAWLVNSGLNSYHAVEQNLEDAMRQVEVVHTGHAEYLHGLSAGSFDVVYFDPMFRLPKLRSAAINSLRGLADPDPIERPVIDLAVKVARKRVVLKERRGSAEFNRLGFTTICGGRYAPVRYGVIDCNGC